MNLRLDIKILKLWPKLVDHYKGYVSAQVALGHYYSYGVNLSKDLSKAVEWYTKAAKQGSTEAQLSLGELYEGGWGVNQSYPLAYSLFNVAAINGCDETVHLRDELEKKCPLTRLQKRNR